MRFAITLFCFFGLLAATGAAEKPGSPGYRGNGTGVSPSALTPLAKAKKLWESKEEIPIPWINQIGCTGGYGSVAFSDGRAFLSYFEPAGDFIQEDKLRRIKGKKELARFALCDASDVLLCLDLKTGKTLWKFVDEKVRGYNPCAFGGEMYVTPCIVGDRVYNYGTLGWVYCHDVKTGEVLWETWLPEGEKAKPLIDAWKADEHRYEDLRTKWAKGKIRVMSMKSHRNAARGRSPVHIDGVLVVHDFNDGIVGLDPATGKIEWQREGLLWDHGSTPVPFGKGMVLAGNRGGLSCLHVTTGKTVWEIKGHEWGFGFGLAVSGPYIATRGGHKGWMGCWKVQGGKPKFLWQGPEKANSKCGVLIHAGHVWGIIRKGKVITKTTGSRVLHAFELETGKISGTFDLGPNDANYKHLAYSDGLFGMNDRYNNRWRLMVADPKNPRQHGDFLPGATFCITLAMADGLVLTRTDDRVVCWQIAR